MKLDYFVDCWYPRDIKKARKNYVNLDVDTVWMKSTIPFLEFPHRIHWICGKCQQWCRVEEFRGPYEDCGEGCLYNLNDGGAQRIRRLAIYYSSWVTAFEDYEVEEKDISEGNINCALNRKVDEILLVVWDPDHHARLRDVTFVEPSKCPYLYKIAVTTEHGRKRVGQNITWSMLEDDLARSLETLKIRREKERKDMIACKKFNANLEYRADILAAGEATLSQLDNPYDPFQLNDLSDWVAPKIKFVEARAATGECVLLPRKDSKSK
jgi:hypothetical protein